MLQIYFNVPQKDPVDMSDLELLKTVANLLSKTVESQRKTIQFLEIELELLKKENELLRKLYNLEVGE